MMLSKQFQNGEFDAYALRKDGLPLLIHREALPDPARKRPLATTAVHAGP